MKEVKLNNGKAAFVDDEDYENIIKIKWWEVSGYAVGTIGYGRKERMFLSMHHYVMGKPIKGWVTDHINGNRLDNRKINLRFVSQRQNIQNYQREKLSIFPGVTYHKHRNTWNARILLDDKKINLGCFKNEIDAFKCYCRSVKDISGEDVIVPTAVQMLLDRFPIAFKL